MTDKAIKRLEVAIEEASRFLKKAKESRTQFKNGNEDTYQRL